jgi:hypothetical protein
MPSSWIWRRVDFVWTDVSKERIAFIFRGKIRDRGTSMSRWLQTESPVWQSAATCSRWFLARGFSPWRWRLYVRPKRWFTQDLHDATSQKTAFFIVTAVKTSNLAYFIHVNEKKWNYVAVSYCTTNSQRLLTWPVKIEIPMEVKATDNSCH